MALRISFMLTLKDEMKTLRFAVSTGFASTRVTAAPMVARVAAEKWKLPLSQMVAV
jgi:hypothetical protein